jgi:hypothetical protein
MAAHVFGCVAEQVFDEVGDADVGGEGLAQWEPNLPCMVRKHFWFTIGAALKLFS